MSPENIRAKVMAFADRSCGISRQDTARSFSMIDRTQARALLDKLEADGTLYGVLHPKQSPCGKPKTRLFTTREAATAWCNAPLPGAPKVKRPVNEKHAPIVRPARQELPALPVKASTEARVAGETKITIAPAFVDRRWVPEFAPRVVDANECSAWARAVTERRAA